jgi:hypothetical protein
MSPYRIIFVTVFGYPVVVHLAETLEDCEAWIEAHRPEFPDNSFRVEEVECPEE